MMKLITIARIYFVQINPTIFAPKYFWTLVKSFFKTKLKQLTCVAYWFLNNFWNFYFCFLFSVVSVVAVMKNLKETDLVKWKIIYTICDSVPDNWEVNIFQKKWNAKKPACLNWLGFRLWIKKLRVQI